MVRAMAVAAVCDRRSSCFAMSFSAVTDRRDRNSLGPVVSDRFDGAAFLGFVAKRFFLRRFGLLVDVGVPAVVVPLEVGRRGLAAEITIDALIVDVEFPLYVLGIFIRDIGHRLNFGGLGARKVGNFIWGAIIFLVDE
jgi:hypothetical protein